MIPTKRPIPSPPTLPPSRPLLTKLGKKSGSPPKAKSKKAFLTLDTNIGAYDRTDPFHAFNTLIKLLGSLPSRIGGCQFKLTSEEHRLSLHLLSIVEPFVGLAPSKRTITRQPTEILDAIIFHIPSRNDLVSLALSCHRMHDVVCPRHLEYRVIRCKVSAIRVWNHLIINRSLARNVRRLEIMDERSTEQEMVPSGILNSDTDLESTDDELGLHDKQEKYLVAALSKMTDLGSFFWSCNHSPISIDNVWPTLTRCQSLKEIDISDNLVFSNYTATGGRKNCRQVVLPDMTSVSLRSTSHAYGASKQPNLTRISGILNHCPALKCLKIDYAPPRATSNPLASRPQADELLLYGRWTHLTSLTLTNLRCSSTTGLDTTSSFLFAHPNLEALHLDLGPMSNPSSTTTSPSRLILLPNTLPRLRELQSNKEVATAILGCPCEQPRPLEIIKGFRLSGINVERNNDFTFLANLKSHGSNVKRMELTGHNDIDDLRRLIECAPGLTWLDVGRKGGGRVPNGERENVRAGSATATATNTLEWATLLSELPDLTTFHGVRFFFEVSNAASLPGVTATSAHISTADRSRIRKNDEVSGLLAWKCPKLRRVDHWEEGSGKVVVLVKDHDKEKVRWEVRRVVKS